MGGNGSGRIPLDVDMEVVLDLLERGEKAPAIATELGISVNTLRARISNLQEKQGVLLQYRSIQALQLTELQARVLEAISDEKINDAPLRDLVASYKILKDKELVMDGKPTEIKGLVAHLIYLEKQEAALNAQHADNITTVDVEEADFSEDKAPEEGGHDVPGSSLALLDDQMF